MFVFIIRIKQIFLGTKKFGGHKKFGVTAPECHPVATGLAYNANAPPYCDTELWPAKQPAKPLVFKTFFYCDPL